jgi:glycosyltransferase involved in cell wall biosynthesis
MNHVCICLATFNGAKFLDKQLASLLDQTHTDWSLLISDDGSTDATKTIISKFIKNNPDKKISLLHSDKEGFVKNFLSLICHNMATGEYFAFVDQDDIWLPEKLEVALRQLNQLKGNGPKLYGGRTVIIDADDNKINQSPLFKRTPSFQNALVQSIAGGNTLVFNHATKQVLKSIGSDVNVISHDWWAYIVVSGIGGAVIYDPVPQVLYRDHDMNMVGSNQGIAAQFTRLRAVMAGQYLLWNDMHIKELQKITKLLQPANRNVLDQFIQYRSSKGIQAIKKARKIGLYRQSALGTISLYLASFLGKV